MLVLSRSQSWLGSIYGQYHAACQEGKICPFPSYKDCRSDFCSTKDFSATLHWSSALVPVFYLGWGGGVIRPVKWWGGKCHYVEIADAQLDSQAVWFASVCVRKADREQTGSVRARDSKVHFGTWFNPPGAAMNSRPRPRLSPTRGGEKRLWSDRRAGDRRRLVQVFSFLTQPNTLSQVFKTLAKTLNLHICFFKSQLRFCSHTNCYFVQHPCKAI